MSDEILESGEDVWAHLATSSVMEKLDFIMDLQNYTFLFKLTCLSCLSSGQLLQVTLH